MIMENLFNPTDTVSLMRICARFASEGKDVAYNERQLRWAFEELDRWLSDGGFLPNQWGEDHDV